MDETIYIDNNKNISNKSRYSESIIFQNEQNETVQNQQLLQYSQKQNLAQELKFLTTRSANNQQESENDKTSESNLSLVHYRLIRHCKQFLIRLIRQDVSK
nr:hypothetical protein [Rickettsia endosymbiont of Ixodes pacificus]